LTRSSAVARQTDRTAWQHALFWREGAIEGSGLGTPVLREHWWVHGCQ